MNPRRLFIRGAEIDGKASLDLRIEDGDNLTVRLEEAEGEERQITVWKTVIEPGS